MTQDFYNQSIQQIFNQPCYQFLLLQLADNSLELIINPNFASDFIQFRVKQARFYWTSEQHHEKDVLVKEFEKAYNVMTEGVFVK